MRVPRLIVFDLDACLWMPEMYELMAPPKTYDRAAGGVRAGRDVVRLFPGAASVLRRCHGESRTTFSNTLFAAVSSTTEPAYARTCLSEIPVDDDRSTRVVDLLTYKQIYPGHKGLQHFPSLLAETGIAYDQMLFFDDCTYSDNCADVSAHCPGVVCVRTPDGLNEQKFELGLKAFDQGLCGVVEDTTEEKSGRNSEGEMRDLPPFW